MLHNVKEQFLMSSHVPLTMFSKVGIRTYSSKATKRRSRNSDEAIDDSCSVYSGK